MFYLLYVNYYRKLSDTDDIVEEERIFRHENPILAREACFDAYQSYIEVLYEYLGKKCSDYDQARKDLKPFFNSGKENTAKGLPFSETEIGIRVYFVYDETKEYISKKKNMFIYKGIKPIFGLDNDKCYDEKIMEYELGLMFEYHLYKKKGWEMKDYGVRMPFGRILRTPYYE